MVKTFAESEPTTYLHFSRQLSLQIQQSFSPRSSPLGTFWREMSSAPRSEERKLSIIKNFICKTLFSFHRLSDYQIMKSERNAVKFLVKFKTEQLVDLELIMPSRKLMMNDVRIKTHGFIPHGNPMMQLVSSRE